jgi:V8-like Glu-specific endopeptidase
MKTHYYYAGNRRIAKTSIGMASLLILTALSGCGDEGMYDGAIGVVGEELEDESQCGGTWDVQDVEDYDGTYGVSQSFVNLHERPVGVQMQNGTTEWCTGTLVSRSLFLSAGHCSYTTSDTVRFNYQVNGSDGTVRSGEDFAVVDVLEQHNTASLDYALVRLSLAPGDRYGYGRALDADPSGGELLTLIQHPNGVPKVVATGPETGASSLGTNWFGHQVDTTGGSSGSGVLNTDGLLVGVHTNAGCNQTVPIDENSAFRMTALLDDSSVMSTLHRDYLWWANGTSFTSHSFSVSGKYQPITGDFDGNGASDIFWYRPGSGTDYIWWANGAGGFSS